MSQAPAPRKAIPEDTEHRILDRSRRRCALCVHFDQDYRRKEGQLAHIDRDPSNCKEDNLAFLCLPHHDDYDSKRRQTKNLTIRELKAARDRLYNHIETGGNLTGAQGAPAGIEADRKTLREVIASMEALPDYFLERPNFGGCSFSPHEIEVLRAAVKGHNKPQDEFVDQDLEGFRRRFLQSGQVLIGIIDRRLVRAPNNSWYLLPIQWRDTAPERYERLARILDRLAVETRTAYYALIRAARKKLEE